MQDDGQQHCQHLSFPFHAAVMGLGGVGVAGEKAQNLTEIVDSLNVSVATYFDICEPFLELKM